MARREQAWRGKARLSPSRPAATGFCRHGAAGGAVLGETCHDEACRGEETLAWLGGLSIVRRGTAGKAMPGSVRRCLAGRDTARHRWRGKAYRGNQWPSLAWQRWQ